MAIKLRNKRKAEFSAASMTDLVFLLLIFFMITSTMVAPNAINVLLPQSDSKTVQTVKISVTIDENLNYYVNETMVNPNNLANELYYRIGDDKQATVLLNADRNISLQYVVNVINAVNSINNADPNSQTRHKVILGTQPN